MAFDGVTVAALVKEFNTTLKDGRIYKIAQTESDELMLTFKADKSQYRMLLSANASLPLIYFTNNNKPSPMTAPNFCMLLRKHLIGYKIKNISSKEDLERIIQIEFEGYNELNDLTTKYLIIELMGKHSNIILLNSKFFIIDSLRHLDTLSNSYRDILPTREYIYPENNKKNFYSINSFDIFYKLILENNVTNLTNFLVNYFTGFSKTFVKNVLLKCNINNSTFSKNDIFSLYEYLCKILNNLNTNAISLSTYSNENNKLDYTINLASKSSNLDCNFFIDDFYYEKEQNSNFISYRNNLLKLISHILKKYDYRLENINAKLKECNNKDIYKLYGELITANLYKIPKFYNADKIELENYYDNNSILLIPLDNTISIANNAKKYFKKYNKLKNALEIVSLQKIETEEELQYIESIIYELEYAKDIQEVNEIYNEITENPIFKDFLQNSKVSNKKDSNSSTPREFHIDGYTVLVGKNNKQNDYLTTKIASKNDIWFHTKDIHGSHVILKNPASNVSNEILIKCAKLAAYYSKARLSNNVPVDYCLVKYVKKPNGSKPGMVIYTNNKTLNVTPCEFN